MTFSKTDMDRRPVAVFDSGIGGLPYLEALRSLLPDETFAYAADREGFPYGRKSRDEVRRRACACVDRIVSRLDPKMIVIACNTASQAALPEVRSRHPGIPVVGTVPAVKPAARSTGTGTIAVLSTDGTAKDPYLDELISRHARGVNVVRAGVQDLVDFVENEYLDASDERRLAVCKAAIDPLRGTGADRVVLACTHFLHLTSYIAAAAGPDVVIVDSREGVSRRAADLLRSSLGPNSRGKPGELFSTGRPGSWGNLPRFARIFGLEFGGSL